MGMVLISLLYQNYRVVTHIFFEKIKKWIFDDRLDYIQANFSSWVKVMKKFKKKIQGWHYKM